jgi:uncharacterized protein YjbI with pentapeptide repeats
MAMVVPTNAIVRPRVVVRNSRESRLLEEVIADVVEEFPPGVVWVVGGPGSGKTTAVAHLAALFASDERLTFLDEPTPDEVERVCGSALVVAATSSPSGQSGLILRLQPWGVDDLVEYLLAAANDACQSVIGRLGRAANWSWTPELACLVLDHFVVDPVVADPAVAIMSELKSLLPNPRDFANAAEYCLATLVGEAFVVDSTRIELAKIHSPRNIVKLLRHSRVQLPLAAERLVTVISTQELPHHLLRRLPRELVELVGQRCRCDSAALHRLHDLLASPGVSSTHSMAASILSIAEPTWRPANSALSRCHFSEGLFHGVDWKAVDLARSELRKADFSSANLENANLEEADATTARFQGANLRNARLIGIRASHADFRQANLAGTRLSLAELAHAQFAGANLSGAVFVKADLSAADLSEANFTKADLCGAKLIGAVLVESDFTDAKLDGAHLDQADLRRAVLQGACFDSAFMTHAQMEDVVIHHARFKGARLQYAHLTGSMLYTADFRGASLAFAHLAEVDWPLADLSGADLRGASFHMGSSRSGLVGSPIACEGSKTGFYTDEREEMYFKRPEEIRKANLRGADLRGARIEHVDFYLVDLREARLDPAQIVQARQTGAILEDFDF